MEEIARIIKENHMFFIATLDKDQPRVRPFKDLVYSNQQLYINTGNNKAVYQQLCTHPKVELCSFGKGGFIRVQAVAELCKDKEVLQDVFEKLPHIVKRYENCMDQLVIFSLQHIIATSYEQGEKCILYQSKNQYR